MADLNERIRKIIEENGWHVGDVCEQDGKFYVEIGYYSNLGEDFGNVICFNGTSDGFVSAFSEAFENYDVDDHAAEWVEYRGENGVPSSIQALLDDAYDIGEAIDNLEMALSELDLEDDYAEYDDENEDEREKPYKTKDFHDRYVNAITNSKNIVGMLNDCNDITDVSRAVQWGIGYEDMVDLSAGYAYGTEKLKHKIDDFLEDINFHTESGRLVDETDEFIPQVLDKNSDYVKEFWDWE